MLRSFTTESTESTETDRRERKGWTRIRNPFLPASVPSVPSVVRLRIAPVVVKSNRSVTSAADQTTIDGLVAIHGRVQLEKLLGPGSCCARHAGVKIRVG